MIIENDGLPNATRRVIVTNIAEFLGAETFDASDENGNGLIDETGFAVSMDGRNLTLFVGVQAATGDGFIGRSQSVTVRLWND